MSNARLLFVSCFRLSTAIKRSSHLKDLDDQQYNEDLKLGARPTEGTRVSDHSVTAVCVWPVLSVYFYILTVLSSKPCGVRRGLKPKSMVQLSTAVCLLGGKRHVQVCVRSLFLCVVPVQSLQTARGAFCADMR